VTVLGAARADATGALDAEGLAKKLIPDRELAPGSVAAVAKLPTFGDKLRSCERLTGTAFGALAHEVQELLVLRRLEQLVNTVRLNPLWRERLRSAGLEAGPLRSYEDWQRIPLTDKSAQRELHMGQRPGLVVPLDRGGFEIVASGGTSDGQPLEVVYSLRELTDTYQIAGRFMGEHQLPRYLVGPGPRWLFTNLADYQMWSSGTMVGGVLSHVPGINYIGAGPVTAPVLEHMFSYPGPKAMMGISAGIAILSELGAGMDEVSRESFRVALYGSGVLAQHKHRELKALYPNLKILSYFAATQAETIGLQLTEESPALSAVPGLHLIEVVDEDGREVPEGAEGELVVTRLHAHEAPLLRLKLGDRMVRRPRLESIGLNTTRFEFAGRTGDVLHLNDSQYSAHGAYRALREEIRTAAGLDLDDVAQEIQYVNHREVKALTLLVAADDPDGLSKALERTLGAHGIRCAYINSLPMALSLFNHGEANPASIEKTGYSFHVEFVPQRSPRIERTAVGKVPLVVDHG
jgi:phenylacetate-CoA ligase